MCSYYFRLFISLLLCINAKSVEINFLKIKIDSVSSVIATIIIDLNGFVVEPANITHISYRAVRRPIFLFPSTHVGWTVIADVFGFRTHSLRMFLWYCGFTAGHWPENMLKRWWLLLLSWMSKHHLPEAFLFNHFSSSLRHACCFQLAPRSVFLWTLTDLIFSFIYC